MNVTIRKHAIERFLDWQRTTMLSVVPEKAEQVLTRAALKGRVIMRLPGGAVEIEYKDLYLVVKRHRDAVEVITFNGDRAWRNWYRKHHSMARCRPKAVAAL
ncbi:MAG: hypothetical protein C4570_03685 [Ammonifex sp.]|nr:MAG: hypothetical protein C4570_03685 [Ammonifex sp.]